MDVAVVITNYCHDYVAYLSYSGFVSGEVKQNKKPGSGKVKPVPDLNVDIIAGSITEGFLYLVASSAA